MVRYNMLMPEVIEQELTFERRARRIRLAFRNLQRTKLIETRVVGLKMQARLTEKGRTKILLYEIRNGRPRTDGRLVLVSFDIPERVRSLRCLFTHKLKSAGLR